MGGHQLVDDDATCDLLVLAAYTRILPESEFQAPRLGTLCFHPSLLPRHRGRDAVWWTLHLGERYTGATWFWVDAGIDTGPIAVQAACAVPVMSTPSALYYDHLVPLGAALFSRLLPQIALGDRPARPQNNQRATYEPPRPNRQPARAS